jgi:hypothetical protein
MTLAICTISGAKKPRWADGAEGTNDGLQSTFQCAQLQPVVPFVALEIVHFPPAISVPALLSGVSDCLLDVVHRPDIQVSIETSIHAQGSLIMAGLALMGSLGRTQSVSASLLILPLFNERQYHAGRHRARQARQTRHFLERVCNRPGGMQPSKNRFSAGRRDRRTRYGAIAPRPRQFVPRRIHYLAAQLRSAMRKLRLLGTLTVQSTCRSVAAQNAAGC